MNPLKISIKASPKKRTTRSNSPDAVTQELIEQITKEVTKSFVAKEKQKKKLYAPHRIAKFNKGVQVYEDIHDELARKYKWKKQVENKMVQTDDIVTDELALLQY